MVSVKKDATLEVHAEAYRLVFPDDERAFVYLEDAKGARLADLFVLSSVHTLSGQDDTTEIGQWDVTEDNDEVILTLTVKSSVWTEKTFRFRCAPTRFSYDMRVEGQGKLTDVNYFGGYASESLRWGSGFFWSGTKAKRGFNPEPNVDEVLYFQPEATSVIDLTGVPLPGRGDWFFTPPPFCFAFEAHNGWFGMGVEAKPGANHYTEYRYQGQQFGFYLNLSYEGYTAVDGVYELPAIGFEFAPDEYQAIDAHVKTLGEKQLAPIAMPETVPAWWKQPIFCGWGAQCYEAARVNGHAPDFALQKLYDSFMEALDKENIRPGIVVLDDKWQAEYGTNAVDEQKWPNVRGFADFLHDRGQKMLLWLKAWDPEGVPADECIVNHAGRKIAVDPTNPKYEARFRAAIRQMLSNDGYDADGFKIDFTARIPSGPGFSHYGDVWGLELMKAYLHIIYDEAKKVKPDALVMAHTPHPYLATEIDMIRLNDVNTGSDINPAMIHRARIARIACPNAVIDTDNWPMPNKEAWRAYVEIQADLGVPSLYLATHVDATQEPLEAADYQLIRDVWQRYERKQAHKE